MAGVVERNNVRVFGSGRRTLLFAHGFGCDQNMWRFLTPSFERDHRIVLFDYVGSGRSDLRAYSPERYGVLDGYAEDILDVRRTLAPDDDVVLVGHSVSGRSGALAAIREPSLFRALVFVSPSPRYIDDPPDYVGGFGRADIAELLSTMDRNYIGWATALAPAIVG
ncbi:MAG: alpha/beta fold hydrolase, partial [Myxococcota bacterium]